jgi:outer membrane protein TolC
MRNNKASIYTGVTDPLWHIGGSIQAAFDFSFALFEGMKYLRLQYEAGLLNYGTAKAQLEREVRKSYYQMLLLRERIDLLRESFETADRQVSMAEANYRAGLSPELTLLQAQVSRENLKPQIDQAENLLRMAMASFAMNLGLSFDAAFELIPAEGNASFIALDVKDLISKAAQSGPDVLALKQGILVMESARRAKKLSIFTPALSLSWGITPVFLRDPWKDNWFKGDNWTSSGALTLSLGFRLHSLFPFAPDLQGVKDQDDGLRDLRIKLAQAIRGTELEIYNTVLSLEKARAAVEAQSLTVEMAEKSYRLTEEAYQAGLQEFLQVQNAELSLREARIGVLEQNFAYIQGLIDLEYTMGVPFGTLTSGNQ